MDCEQSILKPQHFKVSLGYRKDRIQITLVEGTKGTTNWLRRRRLSRNVITPTSGSRMAASNDIHPLKNTSIPAQRGMLVDTHITIGLPKGTDGRVVVRGGMVS